MITDSYSDRIRFARSLTKLSREAFQEKHGINKNTLKALELGKNSLTEKSAMHIATAIKNEGFSCSPEWLIFGIGAGPDSFNIADSLTNEISEQSKIICEVDFFKKNNNNSVTMMVTDASMIPTFNVGDYIGGILEKNITSHEKLKKFIGSVCMVFMVNNICLVRKITISSDGLVLLCPINSEYDTDVTTVNNIESMAYVIWHRTTRKI